MRNLVGLLALSALTGCLRTSASWEGIWLLNLPVFDSLECSSDIDENFLDAAPYKDPDVDPGDWEYTVEGEQSVKAEFLEVLIQNGQAIGIWNDEVYVGTADAKTLTLAWESSEDLEDKEEHSSGYAFVETTRASTTETLTLTKGKNNTYTGKWEVKFNDTTTYEEDDEWDRDETGINQGRIPSNILEPDNNGDQNNVFDEDDCSGNTCELTVSTKCNGKMDLTAVFAGDNEGMFNGIEDADRPNGVGNGGGYTY